MSAENGALRNEEVDKLRIQTLYRQSRIAQGVALINLALAIFVFRNVADGDSLAIWGAASFAVYLIRLALQLVFEKKFSGALAEFDAVFWERAHAVTTAMAGALWGLAVYFVLPFHAVGEQTFLGFLLAGTTAGATVAYSISMTTTFAFLLPAIVPFALALAIKGNDVQHAMAMLLVLYLVVLSLSIRRLNAMIVDSLRLRFEQGRLLRELKETQSKLVHSAKMSALGEMAAGIAHEINNPLAIIHFYAMQLTESELPKPALEIAEKIDRTSQRIAKIVGGLRAFARGDAHDKFEDLEVSSVVAETLELCQVRQKKSRVLLLADKIPADVMISARATQITQVLLNLLNNAFDAVEKQPEPWVGLEVRATDEAVTITIADNGPGIPPEVREKIMQPFFTTKEVGKGTGLGLSIAHGIANAHGGRLFLDDSSKQTRFVLVLPRLKANARAAA